MAPRMNNGPNGSIEEVEQVDLLEIDSSDEDEMAWVPMSPEMVITSIVDETINDMIDNIIDDEERCLLGQEDTIWRNFLTITSFFMWLVEHVKRTHFI